MTFLHHLILNISSITQSERQLKDSLNFINRSEDYSYSHHGPILSSRRERSFDDSVLLILRLFYSLTGIRLFNDEPRETF